MYLALMTFNVPLEMLEELCEISVNTAMLWRKEDLYYSRQLSRKGLPQRPNMDR